MNEVQLPMGKVAPTAEGDYDENRTYGFLESVLYDHDSWTSKKSGNKGHLPQKNSEWWMQNTEGGKHAYEQGELAKQKGNTAEGQGNGAYTKGEQAKTKGEEAEAKGLAASLLAQNPPKVGCTLPNHDPDDFWWYYPVVRQDLSGVDYVKTTVWSKGDNLDWDSMSDAEKQRVIDEILASFISASAEDAHAVWNNYVFTTTD